MDKEQNVTIFFKNGKTARFEQVTDLKAYGVKLEFDFLSVSDGVIKTATFDHSQFAGITVGKNVKRHVRKTKRFYGVSDATEGSND